MEPFAKKVAQGGGTGVISRDWINVNWKLRSVHIIVLKMSRIFLMNEDTDPDYIGDASCQALSHLYVIGELFDGNL